MLRIRHHDILMLFMLKTTVLHISLTWLFTAMIRMNRRVCEIFTESRENKVENAAYHSDWLWQSWYHVVIVCVFWKYRIFICRSNNTLNSAISKL